MAEALGLAASIVAIVELSAKVVSTCKHVLETARDAPRQLRTILVEVSSLKSALENVEFLCGIDPNLANALRKNYQGLHTAVEGCRTALGNLTEELSGLSISEPEPSAGPTRRQRIKVAVSWTWKETSVKRLIAELQQYKTTITLNLLTHTTREIREVKSAVDKVQETLTEDRRHKICTWLEHSNPTAIHNLAQKHHEAHTVEWVLRLPEWDLWLDADPSQRFLWIHGIPGAGKTILASFLIEQCQKYCSSIDRVEEISCIYYYCSYRNDQDESTALLRWLVSQLSSITDTLPKSIQNLYRSNQQPTSNNLKFALGQLLSTMETVYLVIDGVDESRPRADLLLLLEDLVTETRFGKIQLLATSRRYLDIESALSRVSSPISMDNEEVDNDIRTFVTAQLDRTFTGWRAAHKATIRDALVEKARGMFRLVVCQIEILLKRRTAPDMYRALALLPQTIEETYEMIFLDIPQHDWPLARAIFLWVYANDTLPRATPIAVNTLCSAMSHIMGQNETETGRQYTVQDIMDICGCLIAITPMEDDYAEVSAKFELNPADSPEMYFDSVRYTHYTVLEYIFSDRIRDSKASYFALSEDDAINTFLGTILPLARDISISSIGNKYWTNFEHYCLRASGHAIFRWESKLVDTDDFWLHLNHLWLEKFDYLVEMHDLFDMPMCFWGCPSLDEHPALSWWHKLDPKSTLNRKIWTLTSLLLHNLPLMSARFVADNGAHLLLDMPQCKHQPNCEQCRPIGSAIEALAMTASDARSCHARDGPLNVAIGVLEGNVDQILLVTCCIALHVFNRRQRLAIGASPPLDPNRTPFSRRKQVVGISRSDDRTHHGCLLMRPLLQYQEPKDTCAAATYCLTPLQFAVHALDVHAVRILLDNGANPNALGGCKPLPLYQYRPKAVWTSASPLHILRNVTDEESDLFDFDHLSGTMEGLQSLRSPIEELLITHGAIDFVRESRDE